MPLNPTIRKVLVIGSGPIVIGQAAEFDYAGAQACRILKSRGINVVLLNSNPATIMTDRALADEIYLEPLTLETVKRILDKEKPDSILATLGGQTGLTLAMQLYRDGFLEDRGIRLLGTNAEAIIKAEDRELFKETMQKIGQPLIPSDIATDLEGALAVAERIGYPVIIRPAFTLGGFGGGVAQNREELVSVAANGLEQSPITQILVEKYIYGWKEIEFEVMRDHNGNRITVCSMENFDPVGVHTGDSIVVAPALTLADREYQMLRSAALDIIDELGIEGGCNCQFALDPASDTYAVIEVNPRVSRSSALASKATGYPIAKVSTQIALGYTLDEIRNDITGKTFAGFEPAIDYVVLKIPKWPFDKFAGSNRSLGTQMKATGEVMAIAPSFEEALQKAVRGAEIGLDSLHFKQDLLGEDPIASLKITDDRRLFRIYQALGRGIDAKTVWQLTRIDPFFLSKLENLLAFERSLTPFKGQALDPELYLKGKKLGYTDHALLTLSGASSLPEHRHAVYKMVDTCAAEFRAQTPYFYGTHDEYAHDEASAFLHPDKKTVVVLGSGPIRIGQGIEFDYSSVHCVWALKDMGYDVVIINNNPETVSTDFDIADRLYFEPLTIEDVCDILRLENPIGVVVAFGGQTAIKLTGELDRRGVRVLGTSADGIDMAEDRARFEALLERCHIRRPEGAGVMSRAEALTVANRLGYPVLVRPSYVIGGQNMMICRTDEDVNKYMSIIEENGIDDPVLVDKYLSGTELEVDVILDGKDVLIPGIMEHIERAGIHSGDSIAVYPPYALSDVMREKIVECSTNLALELGTRGLVNIQYLIYENELYVIEVNPRASRTIPYISKVTGIPMVDVATRVMLGGTLKEEGYGTGLYPESPYVAVKVPVFSFEKLTEVNTMLGPEMKSTGEVLGLGKTLEEALYKGLISAGFHLNDPREENCGVYFSVKNSDKLDAVRVAKKFADLGMNIYATDGTAEVISHLGIDITVVHNDNPDFNVYTLLDEGKVQYVISSRPNNPEMIEHHIRLSRHCLQKGIACLSSLDTASALADILKSRFTQQNTELVDLNHMRKERLTIPFSKMQTLGNDYIYLDNRDGKITCPESLALDLCDRNFSIGGDGLVLIENSDQADARMKIFNKDGTSGTIAANCLRCVAKYLYDKGIVKKTEMRIETDSGIKDVHVILSNGRVGSVSLNLGAYTLLAGKIPAKIGKPNEPVVGKKIEIGGREYQVTCVNVGNPHAVVFVDRTDRVPVSEIGPKFEKARYFPKRINTEFVRIIDRSTIRMRVWERGNGETLACGTGACAAAIAAIVNGYCDPDRDITVKLAGGDLIARVENGEVRLTGNAVLAFEGVKEL
ncbi:MAG: carbamoyl-phosphate synthase large subunit [Clostridia bacterium]|nr:carbamoyl-phosphate synthase large subunit [Clostridia bacterium]